MKNDKPNYTEIENLSAYLDHELSEVEENQLRGRLAQDAELRDKLEDLRLTRYTLRHTPKVRRQRSFTLSPEVVQKQKFAWRAVNFSRMVAVAASVLFVLVLGGEFLFGGSAGMIASAPAENATSIQELDEMEAPMAMEAPAEEAAEAPAMEEPATEPMAEAPLAEAGDAGQEPAAELNAQPTPTMQGTEQPAFVQEAEPTEFGIGGGAPPTETPLPAEPAAEERTMLSEKTMKETPPIDQGLQDGTMMQTGPIGDDTAGLTEGEMEQSELAGEPESAPIPLIRWVQGGLLVLALLGGAAAIYFRRNLR